MVDKKILPSVIQFKPISDRISVLRLKSKFFNITLLNTYAPTELADDATKDDFYEELDQVYDDIPEYDAKILLGDLNAKIGREEAFMPTIGKHSKHEKSNDNGIRIISFASSKSMVVQSTKFPHKSIYKGTWKSPDGKTVNQIDHVLIDNRHKNIIEDIRTFRGADCDSDHYLLGIKVRARINVSKEKTVTCEDKINVENIRHDKVNKNLQIELNNRFDGLPLSDNIEEAWNTLKETVKKASLQILGKKKRKNRRKWLTPKCEELLNERRKLKMQAEQDKKWKDKYNNIRTKTKRTIRNAKRKHLEDIIRGMEDLIRANESRNFYQKIRNLKKGYQPTSQLLEDDV
ncbi:craniofacial development protein 2-like, partial [Zerene cesonia]|uniref:craniofacial development protein 2-like n=1 Tax=Zerene cesonia TaxID=33412 RepID=UPI0018E4F2A7